MTKIFQTLRLAVVLVVHFGFCETAYAKKAKKKKGQLMISIKKAVEKSDSDQEKHKDRMAEEADARFDSWAARQDEIIEIKHSGTSSLEPAKLGSPDMYYDEEVGIDQSGLDSLHSGDIEEESTDINFDEELRDVSSVKD